MLALVGGGTAIVVVAGLWGGTPVRELPLVVLSMLIGGSCHHSPLPSTDAASSAGHGSGSRSIEREKAGSR